MNRFAALLGQRVRRDWRQVLLWASGIGLLGAVAGIWIGLLRVRFSRRYASGSVSPYRGWMKWHHVIGLGGGVFVITWMLSGWISMSPFGSFPSPGAEAGAVSYAGNPGQQPHGDMAALKRNAHDAREIRFEWVGGQPLISIWRQGAIRLLDGHRAAPVTFSARAIEAAARNAVPNGRLLSTERLAR